MTSAQSQEGKPPASNRRRKAGWFVVLLPFVLALGLLSWVFVIGPARADVNEGWYVAHNQLLLRTIPVFPRSRYYMTHSDGIPDPHYQLDFGSSGCPCWGYETQNIYVLPARATCDDVIDFYNRVLPQRGWHAEEMILLPSGNASNKAISWKRKQDRAFVFLRCDAHNWSLFADYDEK